MAVTIHLQYSFHSYVELPTDRLVVELPHEMTLAGLLDKHGIPPRTVWMARINEQTVTLDTIVRDNDVISLYPPIDGG